VGECSHCRHQGITGTLCPLCEDYGFIHESVGVRRCWQEQRQRTRLVARTWQQRVAAGVQRLIRVGKAGNNLPERGQHCLVLRGEEKKDLGQEAVVTKLTASRVHRTYHDANDDGLHVVQDPMGLV
jgi:hypothetical protein